MHTNNYDLSYVATAKKILYGCSIDTYIIVCSC